MDKILKLIGRDKLLFSNDIELYSGSLELIVSNSNILVIGGAGSIGRAVTKEIFKDCQCGDLTNVKYLEQRVINISSSVRIDK